MNKKILERRCITLIEIMIVMFLIALISGVVAYNYRGSLDEGRAFKTREGIERVRTILLLTAAENDEAWDDMDSNWEAYVRVSPLAHNPSTLIKDGWGEKYQVRVVESVDGERDIEVSSRNLERHRQANSKSIPGR